jgi:hypothetical protein
MGLLLKLLCIVHHGLQTMLTTMLASGKLSRVIFSNHDIHGNLLVARYLFAVCVNSVPLHVMQLRNEHLG